MSSQEKIVFGNEKKAENENKHLSVKNVEKLPKEQEDNIEIRNEVESSVAEHSLEEKPRFTDKVNDGASTSRDLKMELAKQTWRLQVAGQENTTAEIDEDNEIVLVERRAMQTELREARKLNGERLKNPISQLAVSFKKNERLWQKIISYTKGKSLAVASTTKSRQTCKPRLVIRYRKPTPCYANRHLNCAVPVKYVLKTIVEKAHKDFLQNTIVKGCVMERSTCGRANGNSTQRDSCFWCEKYLLFTKSMNLRQQVRESGLICID